MVTEHVTAVVVEAVCSVPGIEGTVAWAVRVPAAGCSDTMVMAAGCSDTMAMAVDYSEAMAMAVDYSDTTAMAEDYSEAMARASTLVVAVDSVAVMVVSFVRPVVHGTVIEVSRPLVSFHTPSNLRWGQGPFLSTFIRTTRLGAHVTS